MQQAINFLRFTTTRHALLFALILSTAILVPNHVGVFPISLVLRPILWVLGWFLWLAQLMVDPFWLLFGLVVGVVMCCMDYVCYRACGYRPSFICIITGAILLSACVFSFILRFR